MSTREQVENLLRNAEFIVNFHIQQQEFHKFKYIGKYKIRMWVKKDQMLMHDIMEKITGGLPFEEQIRTIAKNGSYSVEFDIYGV